jgi:hypothetical protein
MKSGQNEMEQGTRFHYFQWHFSFGMPWWFTNKSGYGVRAYSLNKPKYSLMPFEWKQFAQTSGFLHASVSAARNLLAPLEPK